jgi:hypothetical protein
MIPKTVLTMMTSSRGSHLIPYLKAAIGTGVIVGILFLIGEMHTIFR